MDEDNGCHDVLDDLSETLGAGAAPRRGPLHPARGHVPRLAWLDHFQIPADLRAELLTLLPELSGRAPLLRLTLYLLVSSWRDDQVFVVTPAPVLAQMAGQLARQQQGNFVGQVLLNEFQSRVCPLEIRDHRYCERLARSLRPCWPEGVMDLLERWGKSRPGTAGGQVTFVGGMSVSERAAQRQQARVQHAIEREVLADPHHPAQRLLLLLNRQRSTVFRHLLARHYDAARAVALGLEKRGVDGCVDPEASERARQHALMTLQGLWVNPRPLYLPSLQRRTNRIFGDGLSLLGLAKPVRHALLAGTVEFDLRNAQLAINAREWMVDEVQTLLREGRSIWSELAGALGVELSWAKPALKTALYALQFGAGRAEISRPLAPLGEAVSEAFFEVPVIRALTEARTRRIESALGEGRVTTCFGQVIPVLNHRDARSGLAQAAQATELSLLLPVVEEVEGAQGVTIVAWQHDGFTVHIGQAHRRNAFSRRLINRVNQQANSLGIVTVLESLEL